MQDFLKDRPVLDPKEANLLAPPAPLPIPPGGATPFARIVRDESVMLATRSAASAASKNAPAATGAAAAAAAHSSQVKTVVENGRVTRLIVTCSCGKVTEIACVY